eukprot:ctg_112.g70
MTATEAAETYEFQAEVARVMDIIVHSLYSNPDVFLRELVSNASDACDKKRFLSLSSASEGKENTLTEELAIRVIGDENDKTVTITDSGIGMSKSELINNLGQIAASGTAKFVEAIKEGAAHHQRHLHHAAHQSGHGAVPHRLSAALAAGNVFGVCVVPHLPVDHAHRRAAHREALGAGEQDQADLAAQAVRGDRHGVCGVLQVDQPRLERANGALALFRRGRGGVSSAAVRTQAAAVRDDAEHVQRGVQADSAVREARLHLGQVRGALAALALLHPRRGGQRRPAAECVAGDPATEQGGAHHRQASGAQDEYTTFWENFGRYLKVGAFEDQEWSKELLPLLRFHTSQRGEAWVGFDDYIKEMKADQKKRIFYLAAEDRTAAANSPLLEKLNKRGYEVFLLLEPVDELVIQQLNGKYLDDYKLIDVAKADALDDLDAESAADKEQQSKELSELEKEYEPLCRWMQDLMQETVEKVKISKRLTDSPAAVSLSAYAMSPTMERFMKAQATMLKDRMPAMATQKKILEINPSHPIVKRLLAQVKGGNSADKDAALLMYETALLQAGYSVTDLAAYAQRVNKALTQSVDQGGASPANGSEFGGKTTASGGDNEPSSESVTPEVVDEPSSSS